MSLKKLLITLLLTSTIAVGSGFATCQSSYEGDSTAVSNDAGLGGGPGVGNAGSGMGGGSHLEDYQYEQMALVLNRAERIVGVRDFPVPKKLLKLIKVTGKTKKLRRKLRKIRRWQKRYNRKVKRTNKRVRIEMRRELRVFNKFFRQVNRKVPLLAKWQLADALVKLNKNNTLCNGTIGRHFGKIGNGNSRKVRRQYRLFGTSSRKWVLRYLSEIVFTSL